MKFPPTIPMTMPIRTSTTRISISVIPRARPGASGARGPAREEREARASASRHRDRSAALRLPSPVRRPRRRARGSGCGVKVLMNLLLEFRSCSGRPATRASPYKFAHADDAHKDRQHDGQDHHRKAQYQHRLEHGEKALDRRSDLAIEYVGDTHEHLLEAPRFLADENHLRGEARIDAGLDQ